MSSTLKLRELKQLCKQNKLKVSGNKAEVEARLEAAARKKRHVAISIADLKARRDADPDHFTLSIQELVDIFEYLGFKDAQHWSGTEPKDIADLVNEATLEDGYQNDDLASQFVRQLAEYNSFMTCEPTNPRGTILGSDLEPILRKVQTYTSWKQWPEPLVLEIVASMKGVSAVDVRNGNVSPETRGLYLDFYPEFQGLLSARPALRKLLDPVLVVADFRGQAPPANFVQEVTNYPPPGSHYVHLPAPVATLDPAVVGAQGAVPPAGGGDILDGYAFSFPNHQRASHWVGVMQRAINNCNFIYVEHSGAVTLV